MFMVGEIVIASFPFATTERSKRRPCLILASGEFDMDYVVAYITSAPVAASYQYGVVISPTKQNGLKAHSVIRVDKLSTLHDSLISGAIGEMASDELQEVRHRLRLLFQI
jgi:mRNA interferase MazF